MDKMVNFKLFLVTYGCVSITKVCQDYWVCKQPRGS